MAETKRFWHLYEGLKAGTITRRTFVRRAAALGAAPSIVNFILQATPVAATALTTDTFSELHQQETAQRPMMGTERQRRGAGGELKILQWQAPTHASNHVATGSKDSLAASLVSEPLVNYLPDATLSPTLVKEVPSSENGLLSADLTSVTYNLLPDVTWSDGAPFTARDVAFTWRWIMDPANSAVTITSYEPIANVEAVDDLTVRITFKEPNPAWYNPFAGTIYGSIYPEHILSKGGSASDAFRTNPIGTGPYVVESFTPNDQIIYVANTRYREPNKPYFARVNLKGGGDATSAARAVLQTGDFDFAWNLLVEPQVLAEMERGGKGTKVTVPGAFVERVLFNFSNPHKVVDGQRSFWKEPHPFLTDKAVRQAMTIAADRRTMSTQFFEGPPGEPEAANILTGIPAYESKNTTWEFDVEKAKRILDGAGWKLNGDVREKDGQQLKVTYSTSINAVRQKIQEVNKQNWEKIGIKVQLLQIDPGIFFDSAAGTDQSAQHFYTDLEMYNSGANSLFPIGYMSLWYSNNGKNIAQKENNWSGYNDSRYSNPQYDRLYEAVVRETNAAKAAELFVKMNDLLVDDYVVIPLVQRAAQKYGIAKTLHNENVAAGSWEVVYWNIANWNRTV